MSIWIWNVFDDMSIYWCIGIFQKSKQWKNMSNIQKIGYLVTCCLWILIAIPITVIGISIALPLAMLIALGITGLAMFVDLVRGTVDMLKIFCNFGPETKMNGKIPKAVPCLVRP